MKLTPAESLALAGYLLGAQASSSQPLVPDPTLVEKGKLHFQALNCVACHALPARIKAAPLLGSLQNADLTRGCLSTKNPRSPRFNVDDKQVQAIVAALRAEPTVDSDKLIVAKTLTAFRCIACHVRDDFGGVHDAHNSFFQGSDLNSATMVASTAAHTDRSEVAIRLDEKGAVRWRKRTPLHVNSNAAVWHSKPAALARTFGSAGYP